MILLFAFFFFLSFFSLIYFLFSLSFIWQYFSSTVHVKRIQKQKASSRFLKSFSQCHLAWINCRHLHHFPFPHRFLLSSYFHILYTISFSSVNSFSFFLIIASGHHLIQFNTSFSILATKDINKWHFPLKNTSLLTRIFMVNLQTLCEQGLLTFLTCILLMKMICGETFSGVSRPFMIIYVQCIILNSHF